MASMDVEATAVIKKNSKNNNIKGCVKVMEKLPQHILLCYVILILIVSYLLEKKDRTYNSVNDPEIFTLEIELFAPVVRV